MTDYMPKVGTLGLDMMYRTCTVQVNLDFSSEADMVKKLRVSLALQPVATALFANSPFTEGKPNGFLSFRSEIWRDTDNERSGMLPCAFEPGMGFERYVDYALDVPMYFVKRGDSYIDVAGKSFRDLLAGKLDALPGERATISDWANHISTIFPGGAAQALSRDARRRWRAVAAAAGARRPSGSACSTTTTALDAAWDLVKDWTRGGAPAAARRRAEARLQGRDPWPQRARSRARRRCGCRARGSRAARASTTGATTRPATCGRSQEFVARGITPAEELLEKFHGPWGGSVDAGVHEYAY